MSRLELDDFAEALRSAYYPEGPTRQWSEIGEWLKERWRHVATKALQTERRASSTAKEGEK